MFFMSPIPTPNNIPIMAKAAIAPTMPRSNPILLKSQNQKGSHALFIYTSIAKGDNMPTGTATIVPHSSKSCIAR